MSAHSCQTNGQQGRATTSTTSLVIVFTRFVTIRIMHVQQGMHARCPPCSSQPLRMRAAFASRPHSRLTRRMTAAAFKPGPVVVEKPRGDHSATCILLHGCVSHPSTLLTLYRCANDKSDRLSVRRHPCLHSVSARSAAAWEAAAPTSAASRPPCSSTTSNSSVPRRPRGR